MSGLGRRSGPWGFVLVLFCLGLPVFAQPQEPAVTPVARPEAAAPAPDLRPVPRPDLSEPVPAVRPALRPYTRPDLAVDSRTRPLYRAEIGLWANSPYAVWTSLRPVLRPEAITQAAQNRRAARLRGQVCGDVAIQGAEIGALPGPGACGIGNAVRVRSVAGVRLTPAATMDCPTARALKTWVEQGMIPAVGSTGGGADGMRIIGHYSCRSRNNQPGARLSEHSFGRAIDIAGIRLKDGREITVLTGWNRSGDGAILRRMWRAACGPFGTVLGPNANRFHLDHFHFDTARYRSGSYCR